MAGLRPIVGLVAFVLLILTEATDAAVRVRVTRNAALHPSGSQLLTTSSGRLWRGVVLQSEATIFDIDGNVCDPSKFHISAFERDFNGDRDRVAVRYGERQYFMEMDEAVFDRVFSWIENGGTGIYTAPEGASTDEALSDAGMVRVDGHVIAAEFSDLPEFVSMWWFIDFVPKYAPEFMVPARAGLQERHNLGLAADAQGEWLAWVVSDLDASVSARLAGTLVQVKGSLHIYYRQESDDPERCYIVAIDEMLSGPTSEVHRLASQNAPMLDVDREEARLVSNAQKLVCQIAVLRTIYNHNRASWTAFADGYFVDTISR